MEEKGLPNIHHANMLRKWITSLSKEVSVTLRCTTVLMRRLYKRTSAIVTTVKKFRKQGGRQMNTFLEKEWTLQLSWGHKNQISGCY